MSIRICDRCGDVTVNGEGCTCTTPYILSEVHRRHRAAVESARITAGRGDKARVEAGKHRAAAESTSASTAYPTSPADDWAAPRRTAAAVVPGERVEARLLRPDSPSRPSSGALDARKDAAPDEHRSALDPDWLPVAEQGPISTD